MRRSARTRCTKRRTRWGVNPFFDPAYLGPLGRNDRFRDLLGRRALGRFAGTFAGLTQDFYEEVGRGQAKVNPAYFIEKCDVLTYSRDYARLQFGGLKEIVLVRDLRDVYCSSRAFWSVGEGFIQHLMEAKELLVRIKREARAEDTLIVRYEDFIMEPERSLAEISRFLELGRPLSLSVSEHKDLFERHGTSADAKASIGRWRTDLSVAEQAGLTDRLRSFIETFEYPADADDEDTRKVTE